MASWRVRKPPRRRCASGLSAPIAAVKRFNAGKMRAVGAGARRELGMAVEQQRGVAALHDGARAVLARLISARSSAGFKPQQHRRDVGRGQRRGRAVAQDGVRVAERRRDEIEPWGRARRHRSDACSEAMTLAIAPVAIGRRLQRGPSCFRPQSG